MTYFSTNEDSHATGCRVEHGAGILILTAMLNGQARQTNKYYQQQKETSMLEHAVRMKVSLLQVEMTQAGCGPLV